MATLTTMPLTVPMFSRLCTTLSTQLAWSNGSVSWSSSPCYWRLPYTTSTTLAPPTPFTSSPSESTAALCYGYSCFPLSRSILAPRLFSSSLRGEQRLFLTLLKLSPFLYSSEYALWYNDRSVLENHHLYYAFKLLKEVRKSALLRPFHEARGGKSAIIVANRTSRPCNCDIPTACL